MSDKLTEQQVRRVGRLARLNLNDEQVRRLTRELGAILEYVAQLEELDTSDVQPLAHCLPIQNVLRPDEVRPSLSNEQALQNAPQRDAPFFAVPKVLGDGGA